jgi:gliding motility-associated-like protein
MLNNIIRKLFLLQLLVLLLSSPLVAQNILERNWYFGDANRTGILFNQPNFVSSLAKRPLITPYGYGGGVVATDPANGNLLFYTDGVNVYDINHNTMANGTGLVGDATRNQAAVACKFPGLLNPNQYYIFTADATGTIQYYTVDMSLGGFAPNPPTGQLINNTPTPVPGLPAGLSEAMIIIPHANGEDFWLITHESASTIYYITLINAAGVNPPVAVPVGLIQNPYNFAYNPTLKLISVSPKEGGHNIEILSFDNTGLLPVQLAVSQTVRSSAVNAAATTAIYDTEWSSHNQYLYVSVHGDPAVPVQPDLLQIDLTDTTSLPVSILPAPITTSYGLQMGLDSAIYYLYESTPGVYLVGKILDSDSAANKLIYKKEAFRKGGSQINFNAFQFPSFAAKDSIKITLSFVPIDTCANTATTFFPTVEPGADSIVWDFGDNSFGKGMSPVHTYATGGTMTVTAKAFLNGDSVIYTRDVTIKQFSLQVSLVQDTTGCSNQFPFPKDRAVSGCTSNCFSVKASISGSPASVDWFGPDGPLTKGVSTSSSSSTLSPDSAGFYFVVVGDGTGCEAYGYTNIKEYGIPDQRANIWHFGTKAGIDFNPLFRNPSKPAKSIPGPLDTPEGCSIICDNNGQVVFSTDGQNIYNRKLIDITPTPNPPGLGGDPNSTQSALIVPVPNDQTLYYIFTTQTVDQIGTQFELRYSLFDRKPNGGLGQVVEYDKLLFAKSTERITSDGTWLIAHEFGNNAFRAYQMTANGLSDPVITNIGSVHSYTGSAGRGYMEFGNGNQLAVALSDGGKNIIELFDFDAATGILSRPRIADTETTTGQVYGIEFAGGKLFATITDTPNSQLVEFKLDSLNVPTLIKPPAAPIAAELGAMQAGPDGNIYVAINGASNLGILNVNPDTLGTSTIDITNGFKLTTGHSNLGLPNFVQQLGNQLQPPGMSVTGVCFGQTTFFTGNGTDPIDTLTWFFGDGSSVKGVNMTDTSHVYRAPGKYNVILRISNRCVGFIKDIPYSLEIFPIPPNPSQAIPLCSPSILLDANPSNTPNIKYAWSTSDTTRTLRITQYGNYQVTLTNNGGCSTTGNFRIFSPLPKPIDLGKDSITCSTSGANITLNTQLNFTNAHQWFVNKVSNGNTTKTQNVDLSTPGTNEYKVIFTDPVNGCQSRDSITFSVLQSPEINAVVNTLPSTCTTSDGSISVTVVAPSISTDLYTYVVSPPGGANTSIVYNTPTIVGGLSGGAHVVTVTDKTNSCPATKMVNLNTGAFTVLPTRSGSCEPNLKININTAPASVGAINYRIIDANTNKIVDSGTLPSVNLPNLKPIKKGSYFVEVTDAAGCTNVSSPAFDLIPLPELSVTIDDANVCSGSLTAIAAGATGFDWTASQAGSLVNPNISTATVTLNSDPSTWRVRVTASGNPATTCPGKDSIDVSYYNGIVRIDSSLCKSPVTLTAFPTSPPGSYLYYWTFGGSQIIGNGSIPITQSGIYNLTVVNPLTGCQVGQTSDKFNINSLSALQLTVTPPVRSCKGVPFQITSSANRPPSTYQWYYNGSIIPNATSATLTDQRDGNYLLYATETRNNVTVCTASSGTTVTLTGAIQAYLPSQKEICPDNNVVINLTPAKDPADFISYVWTVDGILQPAYNNVGTYPVTDVGLYHVELVDKFNCPTSDETQVVKSCKPELDAPKAFNPFSSVEGNDKFSISQRYVSDQDFHVFIFNRWGEMVYQFNNLEGSWNGRVNGDANAALLPTGTYSWVAKYKGEYTNDTYEKHGGVLLMR